MINWLIEFTNSNLILKSVHPCMSRIRHFICGVGVINF
jgi:hypothetical protein